MLSSIAFALAAIPANVGEELQMPPGVSLFSVEQVRHVANFDYVVGPHTHLYTHEEGVAWWDTNGRLINFLPRAELAERESGVQIIREKIDDRWYRFALMPDRSLKSVTGYMLRDGSEIVARDSKGNDFHPTHDPVLNTQYRMLDSNANTLNTHDLVVFSGSYEVTLEKPERFRFHAPTEHLPGFLDSTDHHIIGQFRGEYDVEQTGEIHSFVWSRSGKLIDWRGLFDPSTSPHAPTEIRSVQAVGLLPDGKIALEVTLETTASGQIAKVLALVDGRGIEQTPNFERSETGLYDRGSGSGNRPGSFSRRIEWLPFPEIPEQGLNYGVQAAVTGQEVLQTLLSGITR